MPSPVPLSIEDFRRLPLSEQMVLCAADPALPGRLRAGLPASAAPPPPSPEEVAKLKGLTFAALVRLPHAEQARLREAFPDAIDALRRQHLAAPRTNRADPTKAFATEGAAMGQHRTEQDALRAAGFDPNDPPRYR